MREYKKMTLSVRNLAIQMCDVATENTESETVGNVCDCLILTTKVRKCG